jgi:Ca2+-binding RTX toxin-like protein
MVSLTQSSPQPVNLHLTLTLSAIDAIENVVGGALSDILIGNSLPNILIGNDGNDILSGRAGNDTLAGGAGKNILIGGFGSDQLSGGASEDLLFGAQYLLEDDTVALDSLRREWTSAGSFDDRVRHLLGTLNGGANDGFTLTPSTVREDSSRDTLNGAGSQDWYLGNRLGFPTLWRDIINEPDLDSLFTEIGSWL